MLHARVKLTTIEYASQENLRCKELWIFQFSNDDDFIL